MVGDKFSVYNNPMGGAPPPPPPPRPSPIHHKFDSHLSNSYMTATTRVEDVLCMQYLAAENKDSSMKALMLLFHSWMPKWDLAVPGEKSGKEKPAAVPHTQKVTTPEKASHLLHTITKGVEKTYNRVVNLFQTAVRPPLQMMAKMAQAVSVTYAKIEQGVTQWVTERAQTIAQPFETAWQYISNLFEERVTTPLHKVWERIEAAVQSLFTRLEKEGERVMAFFTPPIEALKKQMEKYMAKIAEKTQEMIQPITQKLAKIAKSAQEAVAKVIEIGKPYQEALDRKAEAVSNKMKEALEKLQDAVAKQVEKVLPRLENAKNALQATAIQMVTTVWQAVPTASLAIGFTRLAGPFKRAGKGIKRIGEGMANAGRRLGKHLLKGGQKAFNFVAERVASGAAIIASYLEILLRKLFSVLLKLLKMLLAVSYHIALFLLTIPKKLIQGAFLTIRFAANMTVWARNLVSS